MFRLEWRIGLLHLSSLEMPLQARVSGTIGVARQGVKEKKLMWTFSGTKRIGRTIAIRLRKEV